MFALPTNTWTKRNGERKPFDRVEHELRNRLLTKRRKQAMARYLAQLRKAAKIEVREQNLALLAPDYSDSAASAPSER